MPWQGDLRLRAALLSVAAPLALGVDQARFWPGGTIEQGDVPDASLCGVQALCPTWPLTVAPGGSRLRVAIDTPSREDGFELDLIDPSGAVAASATASNVFDAEAFAPKPAAGTWSVRVIPKGATAAWFRLRAKLEGEPAPKGPKRPLLPNLRAVPPYEFGFAAPANPLNGLYPPDTANPPLSVAGQEPASCTADEMAPEAAGGAEATLCLRLTSGPMNVGDGPFVKQFTFVPDLLSGNATPPFLRGPARQRVYWSDGTTTTRDAGTYSFHTTHAHFHDDGILTYELFKVDGPDGRELVPAGKGTKSGFCPADQLFGEWRAFRQDPTGTFSEGDNPSGNCFSPTDGVLALTKGWGDVYRWQRPGQYVEFKGNGDGYYVVRTTVDKSNTTLETSETDNSSYAFIRISGRRVELIERGQGLSHLDPARVVFSGFGPGSQDPYGGDAPSTSAIGGPNEGRATEAGGPGRDRTAPRVGRLAYLAASAKRPRAQLRFTLSEPARVVLTVQELRGSRARALATVTVRGARGTNRAGFSRALSRRLAKPGSYRIGVAASDAAGNYGVARSLGVRSP